MTFEQWWKDEGETMTIFAMIPEERKLMARALMERSWDESRKQEQICLDASDVCDCQFVDDGFCPHLKGGAICKFKTDYKE